MKTHVKKNEKITPTKRAEKSRAGLNVILFNSEDT